MDNPINRSDYIKSISGSTTDKTDTCSNGKTCLIISGGSFAKLPGQRLKADYVIACDKGLEYADKYGIKPDVIAGDFDSVPADLGKDIDKRDALILRYPKEKDDTDTLIAVKYALGKGYRNIILVCALGNRTDHLLANLQTAHYAAKEGAIVRFIDEYEEIVAFSNSEIIIKNEITGQDGITSNNRSIQTISELSDKNNIWNAKDSQNKNNMENKENRVFLSVFSLDDRCEGVNITGTKYEIKDAVLTNTFPVGVSNEFKDKEAAISVRKGSLLVMISIRTS